MLDNKIRYLFIKCWFINKYLINLGVFVEREGFDSILLIYPNVPLNIF